MARNLDLSATLQLIDRMSAPLRNIQSQVDKASQAFKKAKSALNDLERKQGRITAFQELTRSLEQTNQKVQQAKAKLDSLKTTINQVGVPTQKLASQLQRAQAAFDKISSKAQNEAIKLQEMKAAMQAAGINTNRLSSEQVRLAASIAQANRELTRQQQRLDRVRKIQAQSAKEQAAINSLKGTAQSAAMYGVIGAYGISKAVNESKHFQTETARIASLGLGDAATKDALKYAKAMNTYGTSTLDNLQLVRDGMTAFADEHHAQMAAPLLAKMKFANAAMYGNDQGHENEKKFMDMLKVIEMRNGLKSDKAFKEQADIIQQVITATGGRVQAEEWLNVIKTGGVAAKQMDNKAFYYTMEPLVQEMGGFRVGTAMMSAYQNLYQGRTTKRAMNNLDSFGLIKDKSKAREDKVGQNAYLDIGAIKGAELFKKDQFKWMEQVLIPAINAKGITEDSAVMDAIGSIFSNRTASSMFAQMYMQRAQIHKNAILNAGADGIEQLYGKAKGTAAGQELDAKAKFHDTLLELGTAILPMYTSALQTATSAMQGMLKLMQQYPNTTKAIAIGITAIVVAFAVFGTIATVVLSVLGPLALLRASIATLTSGAGMISGLLTLGRGIITAFSFIGSAVVSAVGLIGRVFMGLIPIIRAVGMAFMTNPILAIIGLIAAAALYVWANWGTLGPKFSALWANISAGASSMWQSIVNGATNMIAYVAGIPGRIVAYFSGLVGQMMTVGGQIMDGLRNGIASRIDSVVGSIQSAASRIKSSFTSLMGIHSPSRVFASYGDFMMQGLSQGILANDSPIASMIKTSDNLRSAMDTSQIKFDTRKPITASMANGGYANAQAAAPITIIVNAAPTQSPADIAQLVAQELAKAKLGQTTNNTALYDLPQAWT
nr:phage tail tape measure protein [Moraxella sp. CTOTU47616]